jgi:hypothetical protein
VAAADADAALAEEALAAERLAETEEAMAPVDMAELDAAAEPDAVEEAAAVEEPDGQTGAVFTLMFEILQSVTANCVVAVCRVNLNCVRDCAITYRQFQLAST